MPVLRIYGNIAVAIVFSVRTQHNDRFGKAVVPFELFPFFEHFFAEPSFPFYDCIVSFKARDENSSFSYLLPFPSTCEQLIPPKGSFLLCNSLETSPSLPFARI